jgi:hypothetical protein
VTTLPFSTAKIQNGIAGFKGRESQPDLKEKRAMTFRQRPFMIFL